eukprot:192819-Chlamydomonas_euryale.AAC.5
MRTQAHSHGIPIQTQALSLIPIQTQALPLTSSAYGMCADLTSIAVHMESDMECLCVHVPAPEHVRVFVCAHAPAHAHVHACAPCSCGCGCWGLCRQLRCRAGTACTAQPAPVTRHQAASSCAWRLNRQSWSCAARVHT